MKKFDREFIKKARKGDKEVFALIFDDEYQKEMYIYAKSKLRNNEDAKDAVQSTILEAYENIQNLRNDEKFRAWIWKILRNKCKDIYRQKDMHNLSFEEVFGDNNNDFIELENNIDIFSLIDYLKDREKQIIILYINGYDNKSISKKLKINENTVRSSLMRIKRKIKTMSERMGCENERKDR